MTSLIPAQAESTEEKVDQIRVMIVDDDPWTTKALVHSLTRDPRIDALEPLHSGEEAFVSYAKLRPDVVLMDVNMPGGMSGVEATLMIREIDPAATILILTTVSPGPGIARALEAGAVAALNKTASEDTIRESVIRAAAGDDPRLLKNLAQDIQICGDRLGQTSATIPTLTAVEKQVLHAICEGLGYEEIAAAMSLSAWTVKTHTKNLRQKLHAENLAQLVVRALQYRFIST
ncbi:response regulator [Micrococcoides hystricis]|uniref:Response regulator n=1 Tax=Micrococcoides hystricis TaxID=1572761 RepID=A0ABV6P9I0_9MICC